MSAAARDAKGGYILVAVLGVMLVLTGFMAAGSLLVRSALDTARVDDADLASVGLTRAGVELTAFQLFVLKAPPAAIDGRRMRFAGGTVAPHLTDESGKADLNASDSKLLLSVARGAGLDDGAARDLLACIIELRGPDRTALGAPGTDSTMQQPPPASADPATAMQPDPGAQAASVQPGDPQSAPTGQQKPRPRGYQSIDQLRECPNLTRQDDEAIAPLVTVYNPDGKINILSASPDMLRALPGVSSADVEVILSKRDAATDKKALDDLLGLVKEAKDYGKTTPGPVYTLRLDTTSATGRKKTIHTVLAASKSPSAPYYVLDWWD